MRYAEEVDGPLRVTLHDGVELVLAYIDGGGQALGEMREEDMRRGSTGGYEVHGEYESDGSFACIPQDQIESVVVIKTGEVVEFGNPYAPDHPRSKSL